MHLMHQTRKICHFDNGDISTNFVNSIYCKSGLTGKDLFNEDPEALSSFDLDLQNCHGQRYDGAGVVSGLINGLPALIFRENSEALYRH